MSKNNFILCFQKQYVYQLILNFKSKKLTMNFPPAMKKSSNLIAIKRRKIPIVIIMEMQEVNFKNKEICLIHY